MPELEGLPATLFVDKQGRVRAKAIGYRDLDELRALVRELDAEAAPATPAPSGGGSLGPF